MLFLKSFVLLPFRSLLFQHFQCFSVLYKQKIPLQITSRPINLWADMPRASPDTNTPGHFLLWKSFSYSFLLRFTVELWHVDFNILVQEIWAFIESASNVSCREASFCVWLIISSTAAAVMRNSKEEKTTCRLQYEQKKHTENMKRA